VLVLGSFPGAASLAGQCYYGHPRNHFWPILQALWGSSASLAGDLRSDWWSESMPSDYPGRSRWLLARGVGLWDVYASCERQGSLDADIRNAQVNDLAGLRRLCPALRLIAHNGGESHRHARHTRALGLPVVRLPSSSPANASWSFERKLAAWREALLPALQAGVTPAPASGAVPPDPATR
jgi:hypoxanthine-DNA glycosylase